MTRRHHPARASRTKGQKIPHIKGRAEGLEEGRAEGLAEGRAEGEKEARRKAITNMRAMGMTDEVIAQALGCSIEEAKSV